MTNLVLITAIHLAALSQIESGDNDRAIGPAGEVTRYQIRADLWRKELDSHPNLVQNAADEKLARIVAFHIWSCRVDVFRLAHGRGPTLTELYLLWHRPVRAEHPKHKELDRAERFANLVEKLNSFRPAERKTQP